ncbi:MAG: hypothetical protein GQ569_03950 [Methylococcaceae bacterium]|nr:hypothetical protein [Methylococcaceae bacterium]
MSLKLTELKIKTLLQLFNDRSDHDLELVLTLNDKDNSIRGYGTGFRTGEEVTHFMDLLKIKGIKAELLNAHSFIVQVNPS